MIRIAWMHVGDAALLARERPWLEAVLADGRARVERRPAAAAGGPACFAKASTLRGRAAARHAARRALGLPLPRLAEHANLEWLRTHGFDAPRPLLAGAAWAGAAPRLQFLYTEEATGAETLERLLAARDPRAEPAALELARVAARLHAAGFVHRDLFARNVLVRDGGGLVLLDAWRGGARPGLRGPAFDVGCLVHDLARLGLAGARERILDAYSSERARAGAPVEAARLARAARRAERACAARDDRRRERRSARGSPPAERRGGESRS